MSDGEHHKRWLNDGFVEHLRAASPDVTARMLRVVCNKYRTAQEQVAKRRYERDLVLVAARDKLPSREVEGLLGLSPRATSKLLHDARRRLGVAGPGRGGDKSGPLDLDGRSDDCR